MQPFINLFRYCTILALYSKANINHLMNVEDVIPTTLKEKKYEETKITIMT